MSESKRRGSFEQRKAQAIKRHTREQEYERLRILEIEANKTPEQRNRELQAKLKYAQMMGLILGMNNKI